MCEGGLEEHRLRQKQMVLLLMVQGHKTNGCPRCKAVLYLSLGYHVTWLIILTVTASLVRCGLPPRGQFPFDEPDDPNETKYYECPANQ